MKAIKIISVLIIFTIVSSCGKKPDVNDVEIDDFVAMIDVQQTAEQIALDNAFLEKLAGRSAKGSMGPFTIEYTWSEDGRVWGMMMNKSSVFVKAVSDVRAIYQLDDYLVGVDLREGVEQGANGLIYANKDDPATTEEMVFAGGAGLAFVF